jgi:hypothetical protein
MPLQVYRQYVQRRDIDTRVLGRINELRFFFS